MQPVLFLSQNSNIVVVVVFPIGFKVIVELGIFILKFTFQNFASLNVFKLIWGKYAFELIINNFIIGLEEYELFLDLFVT